MLVGNLVFLEEFLHLLRDHVAIVRDRDERDFFADLGRLIGRLGLFGILCHD